MSGQPASSGLATVPAWVRYGAIAGVLAFACTFAANLAITWLQPATLCRMGPLVIPLFMLGALGVFLALAGAAGFATGRTGGSGPHPALAGLLVGVLGGCALLALIPFMPSVYNRTQDLASVCPGTGSFGGGSFSFNIGPTPPPGVELPTPPPGFFTTSPPPEAFGAPPTGPLGVVATAIGMLFTISFGTGLAVGAAALGGLAGRAMPSQGRANRRS
jgi:hypothetical protein